MTLRKKEYIIGYFPSGEGSKELDELVHELIVTYFENSLSLAHDIAKRGFLLLMNPTNLGYAYNLICDMDGSNLRLPYADAWRKQSNVEVIAIRSVPEDKIILMEKFF